MLQYLDVSVNKETKLITSALRQRPLRGLEPPGSLILRHLWSLFLSCYTLKVTMLGNNIKISLTINKVREGSWRLRDRNIRLRLKWPTEERKEKQVPKAKRNLISASYHTRIITGCHNRISSRLKLQWLPVHSMVLSQRFILLCSPAGNAPGEPVGWELWPGRQSSYKKEKGRNRKGKTSQYLHDGCCAMTWGGRWITLKKIKWHSEKVIP